MATEMPYIVQLKEIFPYTSEHTINDIITLVEEQFPFEPDDVKLEQMINYLTESGDGALGQNTVDRNLLDEAAGVSRALSNDELSDVLDNLLQIFPDACPTFLQNFCCAKQNVFNFDAVIDELSTSDYPKRAADPSRTFEQLKEMLPNADPSYLEKQASVLANEPIFELKKFVENAIEKNDYPTMDDYLKRQKQINEITRYTSDFDIGHFLEIIPDPFGHFLNPERKHSMFESTDEEAAKDDELCALNFLYNHYRCLRKKDIEKVFRINKKNLIKTCERLDRLPKVFRQPRRACEEIESKNIPLLQEIVFIKHRKLLKGILKMKDEKYRKAKEEAKANGLLQTCRCCFDEELIPEECYFCKKGCTFCKECVKVGAENRIGDGHLDFPCLTDCDSEFSIPTLQMVLDSVVFLRMAQRKQMDEIKRANIDGLETCPFCDFATIPTPGDKIFKCLNQDCMKESCRECRHVSHIPLRCNEIEYDEDVKMRTYIENKMTEALLRKCWKCHKVFIKESGCNKMTCSCGAKMCYLCGRAVNDYSHFSSSTCPLYTENLSRLHADAVIRGAQAAKAELGVDAEPNKLKIDPSKDIEQYFA